MGSLFTKESDWAWTLSVMAHQNQGGQAMTTCNYEFGYYLDDTITEQEKKEIQADIMEGLLHDYFRPFVGVVVKREAIETIPAVKQAVTASYLYQDNGYIKLFVTILFPYLPDGMNDQMKNYQMMVRLHDANSIISIPFSGIMNTWRTGWPRHGKDPRYFTYFPWKVLSPLKRFIDHEITTNELRDSLYVRPLRLGLELVQIYQESVLPYVRETNDDENIIRVRLVEYYEKMIEALKASMEHFHLMPSSGYMYTGVYPSDIEADYFLPDTPENNPLVKLELEYLQKMVIKRKLQR